jgi:hypothetical protein
MIFCSFIHNHFFIEQDKLVKISTNVRRLNMSNERDEQLIRANRLGAKEDIIHVSETDDGHDLRDAAQIGEKQMSSPNYRQ